MSDTLSLEAILAHATEKEKQYEWSESVEFYREALGSVPEQDFMRRGEICERLSYASHRFAFQAEDNNDFTDRLRQAVQSYEKANGLYGKLSKSVGASRMLRCEAMIAYLGYWLASGAHGKKKLLDDCWALTKKALNVFAEAEDAIEYGKTYNQFSTSVLFLYCLEWDYQTRMKIVKEAIEHGENTIKLLSTIDEPDELAKAYARTAFCLSLFGFYFLDLDEKESCLQKARNHWGKAMKISEDLARLEMLCPVASAHDFLWGSGTDEALANVKGALEYAKKTRDNLIIGSALDWLTYHTALAAAAIADPDERAEVDKTVFQQAEDARCRYSLISFISPRADYAWIEAINASYIPRLFETSDMRIKRDVLGKAKEALENGLKQAESSGYPMAIGTAHSLFGYRLAMLAEIETISEEKRRILEQALPHAKEAIRIDDQLEPFDYWDRAVYRGRLLRIKYQLAELLEDQETKKNMLQEVILEHENVLKLQIEEIKYQPQKRTPLWLLATLGEGQYLFGVRLRRLYSLTGDNEHLTKAAAGFNEAIKSFQKANRPSRVSECYWKVAQTYGELDKHLEAAESFCQASDNYKRAGEQIPQLKNFYEDYVLYMQAWSEIEKARHHHDRQEYGSAKEHFEKAAGLHKSLKQWSYLEPNYSAWVHIEQAEDLSRKEQSEEAIQAFQQSSKLFAESKKLIQAQLKEIENIDEKQMAEGMLGATEIREKYCAARIAIEEARILDKKGDHHASSDKFGSATEVLGKISQELESEEEKREISFIMQLSQAWQKMTQAEAEASPALYREASESFEGAKEFSANEKTRMLVLGHSRFCRALEAGMDFSDTRDLKMHDLAMQHLESAANYYLRANLPHASEYAKATKILLNAYVQIDNAGRESDLEKKAKLYLVVEKLLQTSANAFAKAASQWKEGQVRRLLENVKEERELASSMWEVLQSPTIVSATAFASPSPTLEKAVGIEKFESAEVQANLLISAEELKVGETLGLEIELANAGKGTALLTRVFEVVPQGFELVEGPQTCRVEDHGLNMRGKPLAPLKTEEVKLLLKSKHRGTFQIKPTIYYFDEGGREKTHEPEPVTVTVKELGISGWLKGEG